MPPGPTTTAWLALLFGSHCLRSFLDWAPKVPVVPGGGCLAASCGLGNTSVIQGITLNFQTELKRQHTAVSSCEGRSISLQFWLHWSVAFDCCCVLLVGCFCRSRRRVAPQREIALEDLHFDIPLSPPSTSAPSSGVGPFLEGPPSGSGSSNIPDQLSAGALGPVRPSDLKKRKGLA